MKNGEGKIFVQTNGKSLRLTECKNQAIKIGDGAEQDSDRGKTLVQLNFNKVESVDVVIEHLLYIRQHLENKVQLALGC